MRLLTYMGSLYRVSERTYREILKEAAETGSVDTLFAKGKLMGGVVDVTEFPPEYAASLLEEERIRRGKR